MTRCRDYITVSAVVYFLTMMLAAVPAGAQDNPDTVHRGDSPNPAVNVEESAEQEYLDSGEAAEPVAVETHTLLGGFAGYRFLSIDSYGGRAAPYDYLHSSPVGGAFVNSLGKDLKFELEGGYLNKKDYHGDLLFDYSGDYRFHLRTESLFHNLDHEPLAPSFTLGGSSYNAADLDSTGSYGIKVEQDLAAFRLKLHDFPLHLNLRYWRMTKDGSMQQIFADQAFEGATNTIYSKGRPISTHIDEGDIGFDAHLGYVDVIYNFTIRQFGDNNPIPLDQFVARPDRLAGLQEHNEGPDSRFTSQTIKLHTSLAGGLVGAASYSYGRRENLSQLSDIRGAEQAVTTLQNAAGDLTYTPCGWFSLAAKYRHLEISNSTPATVFSAFAVNPQVVVRQPLDSRKDTVTVTLSAHPDKLLTVNGEYKGEFLHRENVSNAQTFSSWDLPENEEKHTGTISILSRPLAGLRLKALYSYSAIVHPAYGTSYADKHEGQFLATYNKTGKWGVTASYRARRENNDSITRDIISSTSPLEFAPYPFPIGRGNSMDNATASFWFSPLQRLTVTGSYGFLRSKTDQTVLFTVASPAAADSSNYTAQAQIYSLTTAYQLTEKLDLALALQQIHSFSDFSPQFLVVNSSADTTGINTISNVKTVESSLSFRANYSVSKNLSCTLDYTYRDYDEKNSSLFNGSVNSIMASLTGKW